MIDELLAFALAPIRARRKLDGLLRRADPEFIRGAYLSAAWREPTPRECSEAMALLASGESRISMLRKLAADSARTSSRASAWWLSYALRHERIGRVPLLRAVLRLPLNPLPWVVRLVFRKIINEDPKAAFLMLERVPVRGVARGDSAESMVADRIYKALAALARPKS